MEELLNNIERFLREKALSWGMIALYFWVIICGVSFYLYYHYKIKEHKKKPKLTGKFKLLIERLQKVKALLMESDSNVEEAEEIFDKVEKDAKPLVDKYGDDRAFVKIIGEIRILFDKAYARIDVKERDHEKVARFLKGESGPKSDDDEVI